MSVQAVLQQVNNSSRTPGPTPQAEMDRVVARLKEGARTFARLQLPDRIAIARAMQAGYLNVAERSVHAACRAKGIPVGTALEGEEWLLGPWMVVRHLRLIRESLESIARTGSTPIGKVTRTMDGRLAVRVFPANLIDTMLFSKIHVDVHLQSGIDEATMHASRASFYKSASHEGRVTLVLGAGNLNAIVSMDVISKMFNEGKVCVIKMNPVNAYLGPFLEEAFGEAIARGFVAVVYGGVDEGAYLVNHPAVDEVHITGSNRTYDLLVWGPAGAERDARMARGEPLLGKPITAELGNISPVIVVPGPFRDGELAHQGEHVAGEFANNGSFTCISAAALITATGWSQRTAFLGRIESALAQAAPRSAWYPGAQQRWDSVTADRSGMRLVGTRSGSALPWAIIPVQADQQERGFANESFCPVLLETQVGSVDPIEFLERAVDYANDRLWGTLAATLVVHPKSMKDRRISQAVERAITRLKYGTVALNAFPGLSFAFGTPPWGAHPGSTPKDIQSGAGFVHNTPMLEGIEKAVFRHPLTTFPKPAYFLSHRTLGTMMPRLTRLEEHASWARVPGVVAAAMRG